MSPGMLRRDISRRFIIIIIISCWWCDCCCRLEERWRGSDFFLIVRRRSVHLDYRSSSSSCASVVALSLDCFHVRSVAASAMPGARPSWARERCRISPPRFLAECCKRQLNQRSFVLLYFRLFTFSDLYWVCLSVFSCTVLLVSISQVIDCEDRLRNDLGLYCVEWGVKLYSNQSRGPRGPKR